MLTRMIHSDEGLKLKMSVFESFMVATVIYLIDHVVDNLF